MAMAPAFTLLPADVWADDGGLQISIDRTAVSGLIRAGLPKTERIKVPALGEIRLHLTPPDQVSFDGGEIEARIGYRLSPSELSGALVARYRVETGEGGRFLLRARSVTPEGNYSLPVDLAPFLPMVQLPGRFQWIAGNDAENLIRITANMKSIHILPERLVVQLGLTSSRVEPERPGAPAPAGK